MRVTLAPITVGTRTFQPQPFELPVVVLDGHERVVRQTLPLEPRAIEEVVESSATREASS